jgi:hypothetical protein
MSESVTLLTETPSFGESHTINPIDTDTLCRIFLG